MKTRCGWSIQSRESRPAGHFQSPATYAQEHMSGGRKDERGLAACALSKLHVMRKVFDQLAFHIFHCQLAASKAGYTCLFMYYSSFCT